MTYDILFHREKGFVVSRKTGHVWSVRERELPFAVVSKIEINPAEEDFIVIVNSPFGEVNVLASSIDIDLIVESVEGV